MKLVVENYPERERFLREAFNITCNQLGIAGEPGTVTVRLHPQDQMVGASTDGQTMTVTTEGHYYMLLNDRLTKSPLFELAQVFCHELVHVKQMVRDGLRGRMGGLTFKGQFYPNVVLAFADIIPFPTEPWEVEAYSRDAELAEIVMKYASQEKRSK
jgi:hypothetical protein